MRARVRVYRFSWAVARRLPAFVRSAHASLWLRIFDSTDLADLTVASYAGSSGFEGEDHNFGGLWPWEEETFRKHLRGCRDVLVAGAGGGREMIALARMGFDVAGFDASADLSASCRRNLRRVGISAEVHEAPPSGVPDCIGKYDALVVGRGVYHHIAGRRSRIAFLKDCRRHLKASAPAIIGDFLTRNRMRPEAMEFSVWMPKEPGDFINAAYFHFFTEKEVRSELEGAGFELVELRMSSPGDNDLAQAIARVKV